VKAKHFREYIQKYNSALTFTSFFADKQDLNSDGREPWVWKSGYTIYHHSGSLIPNVPRNLKYAQLYFYDPQDT
jgi:hypothetical protein